MKTRNLDIGCLIYDTTLDDYGIIIESNLTNKRRPEFKFYLIHWQKEERFNIDKEINYRWPAAHLHNRIDNGEVIIINYEKTQK